MFYTCCSLYSHNNDGKTNWKRQVDLRLSVTASDHQLQVDEFVTSVFGDKGQPKGNEFIMPVSEAKGQPEVDEVITSVFGRQIFDIRLRLLNVRFQTK